MSQPDWGSCLLCEILEKDYLPGIPRGFSKHQTSAGSRTNMLSLLKQSWKSKDVPSLFLLVVIVTAAAWISVLPLSSTVQETFLRRFHLASAGFPSWAIQQTIPSMYNFENKVWISSERLMQHEIDQLDNDESRVANSSADNKINVQSSMVNHFPTRLATFADSRAQLKHTPNGYLYLRSRYRGKEIKTTYELEPGTHTEFKLRRVATSFE